MSPWVIVICREGFNRLQTSNWNSDANIKRLSIVLLTLLLVLSACGGSRNSDNRVDAANPTPTAIERMSDDSAADKDAQPSAATDESSATESAEASGTAVERGAQAGMMGRGGMGMMGRGGMRMFHMTPIPEEYAGRLSPVPADAESLARGKAIYAQNCAACHGETGLGDGPAADALNPPPAMIAMTSQMLGDDYLFWRISEGGGFEPFNSAMPAWKAILAEEARWDVINYLRSLGAGQHMGPGMMARPGADAVSEEEMRAEMLAVAVDQGVISQEQADLFDAVHSQIDARRTADPNRQFAGTMRDLQDQLLRELVEAGIVSQEDADAFNYIMDLLEQSGVMQ